MTIKYDKPFLTYEEQIKKLRENYNLSVGDEEIELELLSTLSYYELINGYKDCFMVNNKFIEDRSLIDMFIFNIIDKKFQNILLHYSIYVENIFKTKLAHLIAKNKGIHYSEYLDENKYHTSTPDRKAKLLAVIGNFTKVHFNSEDTPTVFYRKRHNHIPPWILFKNITFNNAIDLYSFLKRNEKLEIISEYFLIDSKNITDDERLELFKNMLIITRKFRNKIAHNYKVIGVNLEKVSLNTSVFKKIDTFGCISNIDIKKKRGRNDIYAMLISVLFLLNTNLLYTLFLKDLAFFTENNLTNPSENLKQLIELYINKLNLPNNFFELFKNIYNLELKKLNEKAIKK
ncbi:CAAX protease [Fusobacterium polymorphum]|uniref:CAAX protease n=1 Tax=Fusobacterium nucleatum subsp. polymorphum TaxID=76857 RepID=A0A2B7YKD8_FUSNP|nr:Abi family protein [Fusobacterium polymorphum]PGH21795.1 CAAX protease [Fusobacterium polymorphum]